MSIVRESEGCLFRLERVLEAVGVWERWESVSFKPAGDGFEDEGLFCHDQAERTYLLQYGADSMYTKALLMWARR